MILSYYYILYIIHIIYYIYIYYILLLLYIIILLLYYILTYTPLPLLLIPPLPHSSSPHPLILLFQSFPSQSSHSFYTCRYLQILTYIPNHLIPSSPPSLLLPSFILYLSILIYVYLYSIFTQTHPAHFIGGMSRVV